MTARLPLDGQAASGSEVRMLPEEELLRRVGKLDGKLRLILEVRELVSCLEWAVASRGTVAARPEPATVKEVSL
jgi:hypothetical protein